MVRIAAALLLIGLTLAPRPAAAQFGNIFGSTPPRPPADVPNGGFPPQPPPVYPGQAPPPYAAPTYQPSYNQPPPQQQYPPYPSQAPYASQSPYAPPPGGPPPSAGPPPSSIQARPLPPPAGASQAPAPAASAPASGAPSAVQQAHTGSPPATAPSTEPPADAAPPDDTIVTEMPTAKIANGRAVFSGLDKITGRTISFDAAIGETVQFGALQVTPRVCYTRPPTEATNTDAFVQVDEVTLQGEIKRIFSGWMFASSPGLHAVEHPIYDVWLTDCAAPVSGPVAESSPAPALTPPPAASPQRTRQATPRQAAPRQVAPRQAAPAAPAAPVTDD